MQSEQKVIKQFKLISAGEGLSFLILLFIAMPLKYLFDFPLAVKVFGMVHGVLFVGYVIYLLVLVQTLHWPVVKGLVAFIASFIPFGTFIVNKKMLP